MTSSAVSLLALALLTALLCAFAVAAPSSSPSDCPSAWKTFLTDFNKVYSPHEAAWRYVICVVSSVLLGCLVDLFVDSFLVNP